MKNLTQFPGLWLACLCASGSDLEANIANLKTSWSGTENIPSSSVRDEDRKTPGDENLLIKGPSLVAAVLPAAAERNLSDPAAVPTPTHPTYDPSAQIRFSTASGAEAKRRELVGYIWSAGLPTNALPTVSRNIGVEIFTGDLSGLKAALAASVDRLDANVSDFDFHSIAYLIHPLATNANSARLVIAHQGHQGGLGDGVGDAVNQMLQCGFTVLAMQMPLVGWNTNHTIVLPGGGGKVRIQNRGTGGHDEMFRVLTPSLLPSGTVYRFFLEPVVQDINYFLRATPAAGDVSMFGLSGGGWTTHMAAAVDPRIRQSFPVAGSLPLYCRPIGMSQDTEQYYEPLYREVDAQGEGIAQTAAGVASWLEIYALASWGSGRRQIQILNLYDPCCFSGDAFKTYTNFVSSVVRNLGQGEWSFHSDTTHKVHQISSDVLNRVILPALLGTAGDSNDQPVRAIAK